MTREEAIVNLNMISVAFVEPVTEGQRKLIDDTFEMAIKALEQEPCEDCISRRAVLDKIRGEIDAKFDDRPSNYNHEQRREFYRDVLSIIDNYRKEQNNETI